MKKIAVFPGSFDPFTVGHASIVERGLPLFDEIVIGVGVNERKRSFYSPEERVRAIEELYAGDSRIRVVSYKDLTIDFARRVGPVSFCAACVPSRISSTSGTLPT